MRQFLILLLFVPAVSCEERAREAPIETSAHGNHRSDRKGAKYAEAINEGTIAKDTLKGSPRRMAMGNVGDCHVHIDYSSPGVKGRVIWGGLVPFGEVWVAGAHEATTITFSAGIRINGSELAAGRYGFFTIPGRDRWTLIFNRRADQHLADEYNADEDVLRVEVAPNKLERMVPRLTYEMLEQNDELTVSLQWEYVSVAFTVTPVGN